MMHLPLSNSTNRGKTIASMLIWFYIQKIYRKMCLSMYVLIIVLRVFTRLLVVDVKGR